MKNEQKTECIYVLNWDLIGNVECALIDFKNLK